VLRFMSVGSPAHELGGADRSLMLCFMSVGSADRDAGALNMTWGRPRTTWGALIGPWCCVS